MTPVAYSAMCCPPIRLQLLAEHHFGRLDNHRHRVARLKAQTLHRAVCDGRDNLLAANVHGHFRHDAAKLYIFDGAFELIACAELHSVPPPVVTITSTTTVAVA